jgi:predicted permease
VDTFRQDLRFAIRTLTRSPGYTAAAVLTLALGIGATTAIFSVVHGVLLRPLPYPDADRIVRVWQVGAEGGRMGVSDPNFEDLQAQSRSFAALAQFTAPEPTSVLVGGEPLRVPAARASRRFLEVLGVQPLVGRWFLPDEQRPGAGGAVIVSHRFWQQHLAGDRNLSARTLTFGNRVHAVIGVLPPQFDFPAGADLLVPREVTPPQPSRTAHNWQAIGRLRDGVTLDGARAEISALARRLKGEYGDATWMVDAAIVPLRDQLVGPVRRALLLLLAASAVLLLIACANVTNLFLARIATRQRELAVRLALGASRVRLVQQFLAESFALSIASGVVGVGLALLGVRLLLALEPAALPRVTEISVSWMVLAFALGVSLLTAGALGLFGALRGVGGDLREALAQSQRTMAGGARNRARSGLVIAQLAMTLVLLVGAGLLGRSFLQLLSVQPGYRTGRAVVLELALPFPGDEADAARQTRVLDDLIGGLRTIPGVRQVGGVNAFPLKGGAYSNGMFLEMASITEQLDFARIPELAKDPARAGYAHFRVASEDYFRAMGIPLVRGRFFDSRDGPDAPHVAVISESLAKTEWPNTDPIGKIIQFGNMDGDLHPFTIVGIVGDIRESSLEADPEPTFYASHRQRPRRAATFNVVMQGDVDPGTIIGTARTMLRRHVPDAPPRFLLVEEVVASSVADRRFSLVLLGVFGGAALLLAMLGIYSVISFLVAQREQEIGVRVALGAQRADVIALVLRQAAVLIAVGIVLGVAASIGLTRVLAGMLYGISATDPLAFALVVALLAATALLATWLPARRAARVDPMTALRNG